MWSLSAIFATNGWTFSALIPCRITQRGLNGVTRIATIGDFPVETLVKMSARSVLQP